MFDGIDITGEKPFDVARHGLARTHQIVQPLTNMTVLENCTVGACFGRENLPLARAREVAREAIAVTGLDDRIDMLALAPDHRRQEAARTRPRARRAAEASCCSTRCWPASIRPRSST